MKTKILAVLLSLTIGGITLNAQDHKGHQQSTPAKTEKCPMMKDQASCCPEMKSGDCGQTGTKTETMDHSKMNHSQMQMDSKDSKTASAVVYTCPMHSEVKSDKPGKCPKCGMDLVKKK